MALSTNPRLLIPRDIHEAMLAQAAEEAPNECCGLLVGPMPEAGDYQIIERYPLVNALASPTEFESEPRGLFDAHRRLRDRGWEILAVYHSHPTSPASPSKKDRAMSYSKDVATVIISLSEQEIRAWWIDGDVVAEAQIEVVY